LTTQVVIGIDLAGKQENPSGWATWENKKVETCLMYKDSEMLEAINEKKPEIIAVDAPFSLPKRGILRKADTEMIKNGYRIFPPTLPAMRTLTTRAIKLNRVIEREGFKTIEVHPTSSCKALNMVPKDWEKIQTALTQMGLEGSLKVQTLTPHEIDATVAALTADLYLRNETRALGDEEEGYIIVPKKRDWRMLQI
jgi:predicted nuclease with RNAse H fold